MQYIVGAMLVQSTGINVALKCCVSMLVTSLLEICSIINNLNLGKHCPYNIKSTLDELDIYSTSQVMHIFISELDTDKIQTRTILQALDNLKSIILEIEECLKLLKYRHEYNNSLWITYCRLYTFDDIIIKLKTLTIKLDKRYSLLIETLKVKECLVANKDQ